MRRVTWLAVVVSLLVCVSRVIAQQCPGDLNTDGQVTIDEILTVVSAALNGCPPPTAAGTPSPTLAPSVTATSTPTLAPTPAPEQVCLDSGGTVATGLCCLSTDDFPNTCSIGACGCPPQGSHQVQVCNCAAGQCFGGASVGCVPLSPTPVPPTSTPTVAPTPAPEQVCVDSGGTVATGLCCLSADDFPNTCSIGACGCPPQGSHQVQVCNCGAGQCFAGGSVGCVAN